MFVDTVSNADARFGTQKRVSLEGEIVQKAIVSSNLAGEHAAAYLLPDNTFRVIRNIFSGSPTIIAAELSESRKPSKLHSMAYSNDQMTLIEYEVKGSGMEGLMSCGGNYAEEEDFLDLGVYSAQTDVPSQLVAAEKASTNSRTARLGLGFYAFLYEKIENSQENTTTDALKKYHVATDGTFDNGKLIWTQTFNNKKLINAYSKYKTTDEQIVRNYSGVVVVNTDEEKLTQEPVFIVTEDLSVVESE